MLDALYKRRLERDLERWRAEGWVTPQGAAAIRGSLREGGARLRTAAIFGFLGACLITASAIAFVSANWADFPRPARLALLVGAMALCYLLAYALHRRAHERFADAAVFSGAAMFGASIALVAQTYHISGDFPDALLMWGCGALLAAVAGRSRASLVLALGVFALWAWYEIVEFGWLVHWPSLLALAAVGVVAGAWRWQPGRSLVALALVMWTAATVVALGEGHGWSPAASAALLVCCAVGLLAASVAVETADEATPLAGFASPAAWCALVSLFALLGLLQVSAAIGDGTAPFRLHAVALFLAAGCVALARSRGALTWIDAGVLLAVACAAVAAAQAMARSSGLADAPWFEVALGCVALAAAAWAVAYGQRVSSRQVVALGLVAFALQILYIYLSIFGTLLDTSIFFLVGGLLMILLAVTVMRLQNRLARR